MLDQEHRQSNNKRKYNEQHYQNLCDIICSYKDTKLRLQH